MVLSARCKRALASGVLLQEKARVFFAKFYPNADTEMYKGSTRWLRKFNLYHSIKNTALRGELLSADLSASEAQQQNVGVFPAMAVSELWAVPGPKVPG